jgi:hypothetical protein
MSGSSYATQEITVAPKTYDFLLWLLPHAANLPRAGVHRALLEECDA